MMTFRPYQQDAFDAIVNELQTKQKCIVKMFCGSGKSRIMRNLVMHYNHQLSVFVFPSLSLIDQFHIDYLKDTPNVLKISSDKESTTDTKIIIKFLKKKTHKIICITYQSFELLLDNLQDNKIDICCFDEAHHAVGNTYQKLIFNDENLITKQIFFTATPKNANGIVMYDRNELDKSMCGNLVYDYSYLQGVNEGFLNPFEIRCDLYTENTNKSIYESIVRAVLTTGNNRVLTFHSNVNSDTDTSVSNFVNESTFKDVFKEVVNREFPDKKCFYKRINMIGLDATTEMAERRRTLKKFKKCEENTEHEIVILSSCETIGEGVDTNDANMCVFVDPKSSIVKIIQNIGRIVRKEFGVDRANSTILIPCWVDKDKYAVCNGVKEECDKVIREDMSAGGNFSGILNVMSALQQEQPDVYDVCMNYPDSYTYNEIESNFIKQGYKIDDIVGEGTLQETIEYILDREIEDEYIEDISKNENVCIEVYTELIDEPLTKYNDNCGGNVIRMYKSEDDAYQPVTKNDGNEKCSKTASINSVDKKKRINVNMYSNSDIEILWNIENWNCDLNCGIKSCILNCEVTDIWNLNLDKLKTFIDTNKTPPTNYSKDKEEKYLGSWLYYQNKCYKRKSQGMRNVKRYEAWKEFVGEYNDYLTRNDDKWNSHLENLRGYLDINKKIPSSTSKDKNERFLGCWLNTQNHKHKTNAVKTADDSRYNIWSAFLDEYKICSTFQNGTWDAIFGRLNEFIGMNKKKPSKQSKDNCEKFLGCWLCTQNMYYKTKIFSMADSTRYDIWSSFLEENGMNAVSHDDAWDTNFGRLNEFIGMNKKKPSKQSKDNCEKFLGCWLCTQNNNYKTKIFSMADSTRYDIWSSFLEENSKKTITQTKLTVTKHTKNTKDITTWDDKFERLKYYIETNKAKPSTVSKNIHEKVIAYWLNDQIANHKNKKDGMKDDVKYKKWSVFQDEYSGYLMGADEKWTHHFNNLKDFINEHRKKPSSQSNDKGQALLGRWICSQNKNYKGKLLGMKQETQYNIWSKFLTEYKWIFIEEFKQKSTKSMKLVKPIQTKTEETPENRRIRTKSQMEILHKRYKTLTSSNLNKEFKENTQLWNEYHEISEKNEESFPENEIPRNKIIQELDKLVIKRKRTVVDMGCGKGQISKYFTDKNDKRFQFINYDHVSNDESVISCDISNVPLEDGSADMVILSLAMWGSNCKSYIAEANRILDLDGKLYIIEATKRWSEKDENHNLIQGEEGGKLRRLLVENNFQILESEIKKFSMFTCRKIN